MPAGACTVDLELFFDMFPPDPIAPDPTVTVDLINFTPGETVVDVLATVSHSNGAVQELKFPGAVGANQPAGSGLISNLTVTPGSLDLDIELATTASFDSGETAIEIDLTAVEVVAAPSSVPRSPPWGCWC